ncbi:putative glutamyl endopeptidase [Citrus sinensis]|uniref:Glutamyl endopeptidase n=1 Tax=Citrus sinensis TaxID=2711 RepID=A0ACB8MAF6_CITSI|nr:putative glutamyl endopeptidase [Citrus sinensis]
MGTAGAESVQESGFQLPAPELREIVDAPALPSLSFSPQRDKILFLKRSSLLPLVELARPEEKLASAKIDVKCNGKSRMPFFTGIGIHRLLPDDSLGPEKEVHGYPDGAKINFVSWSPDGKRIAFSVRVDEEDNVSSCKLRVWIADAETGEAKPLFESPDICLNAVFGSFVWVNNSTLLIFTIPSSRRDPPKKTMVPLGPKIQSNEQKNIIISRMTDNLLKDEYDESLFDYYTTAQLVLGSLDGTAKDFGTPAVYTAVEPSPDQKYVLITSMHRPYSYKVPCARFSQKVQVWTTDGKLVRELCDLPPAEDIPVCYNSVREGMRSISWRADKPSTLYWVEAQDRGDANVELSPRDIIYTQPAEPAEGEKPEILHKLDLRFRSVSWCDDSLALVNETWYKTSQTRTWLVCPGSKDVAPRVLFDRVFENVYSDPGSPMMTRTSTGTNVGEEDINLNQLKILTSKESKTEITQYHILSWPLKKSSQITNFPHPYPTLASLQKEMIKYQRKDGVPLTATLYLPPGYDQSKDGPLPCLFWAYPEDYKSKDAAGQVRGSPNEFSGMTPTSSLIFLARRFAVLAGPSIPIIGEGDKLPNDRFVEQLVSSAEAAVEEVVRRGVADPSRIAVGGHSYGAFMTAHLLAHAPHLFCCGIARSGSYNKTLTPFGFQTEFRTLWEATNVYIEMSPITHANKIKKPILIIHGEVDDKVGLFPMQAERFFDALKGHGALSRLVLLPFEHHVYAARENVMHVIWETDRWLQKYCLSNTSDGKCGA